MDALQTLVALLMQLVAGGAISAGLDSVPQWKNWSVDPRIKLLLVGLVTAASGVALLELQMIALPKLSALPPEQLAVVAWLAQFIMSQFAYGKRPDAKSLS